MEKEAPLVRPFQRIMQSQMALSSWSSLRQKWIILFPHWFHCRLFSRFGWLRFNAKIKTWNTQSRSWRKAFPTLETLGSTNFKLEPWIPSRNDQKASSGEKSFMIRLQFMKTLVLDFRKSRNLPWKEITSVYRGIIPKLMINQICNLQWFHTSFMSLKCCLFSAKSFCFNFKKWKSFNLILSTKVKLQLLRVV